MQRPKKWGLALALFLLGVCSSLTLAADSSGPSPAPAPAPPATFDRVRVPPADEADKNPEFKEFREQLLEALKNHDLKFVLEHVDKNITCSYGAEFGLEGFMRVWNLNEKPEKSALWTELEKLLRLGGIFTDEELSFFVAPYTFINFPTYFDAYEYSVAIEDQLKVFAAPDPAAPVIATLSYEIVRWRQVTDRDPNAWEEIFLYNGKKGYVHRRSLRSPIDYRAGFENDGGEWKMTFLVAGD
jgi:hypothetical protein